MKYLKLFKNESDFSTYKEGDEYIVPNICYMKEINRISIEPLKLKRIATFEVTEETSNCLFSNCSTIKSIKVNGELDTNFKPYKGDIEVVTSNVEIFEENNLPSNFFVMEDNGYYNVNIDSLYYDGITTSDIIKKFSKFNIPEIISFDEDVNSENLAYFIGVSSGDYLEFGTLYFSEFPLYYLSDERTLLINDEIKTHLSLLLGMAQIIFIYDITNPYKKYSFLTKIHDGTKEYYVNGPGVYEVEVEFSNNVLPRDLFVPENSLLNTSIAPGYRSINPLKSINNNFLINCTIPSFNSTSINSIIIPSSSKLPLPIAEKFYDVNFRDLGMYWENNILGLFSFCPNLTTIEFEEGTRISPERLLNFITDSRKITSIDFKNVIWDFNDSEFYEKIKYNKFDKSDISLSECFILMQDYHTDVGYVDNHIKYINLNGMIDNYCQGFSINGEGEQFYELEEINFGESDFSNITNLKNFFKDCYNLKKITMLGPINENPNVSGMFSEVAEEGLFRYDVKYDYSKIINELPSGWGVEPFINGNIIVNHLKITGYTVDAVETRAPITYTATISYNDNGVEVTKEISGTSHSNKFGVNPNDEPREIEIEFELNGKKATTTVTQNGMKNVILAKCDTDNNWHSVDYMKNSYLDKIWVNSKLVTLDEFKNLDNNYSGVIDLAFTLKNDISNVFQNLFYSFFSLLSIDLSHLNYIEDNGASLANMFYNCSYLKEVHFGNMNISYINIMANMFYNCSNITEINLSDIDISNCLSLIGIFKNCKNLKNIQMNGPLHDELVADNMFYGVPGTTDGDRIFYYDYRYDYSKIIEQLPYGWLSLPSIIKQANVLDLSITGSNVDAVEVVAPITYTATVSFIENGVEVTKEISGTSYSSKFETNPNDEPREIEIEFELNGKKATTTVTQNGLENVILGNASYLGSFDDFDINKINKCYINNIKYTPSLLYATYGNIGNYNFAITIKEDETNYFTSGFTNFMHMEYIDLSHFKRNDFTDTQSMFYKCSGVDEINLSNLDVSNVTSTYCMFYGCTQLDTVDFTNWNAENLKSTVGMFYSCTTITEINLSDIDISNVEKMHQMFYKCKKLKTVYLKGNPSNVIKVDDMFYDVASDGKLYYDGRYDYSNIIAVLPTTWQAIPYDY